MEVERFGVSKPWKMAENACREPVAVVMKGAVVSKHIERARAVLEVEIEELRLARDGLNPGFDAAVSMAMDA